MTDTISVQGIYAGLHVADLDRGVAFYASLMGREPDDRPMPGMAQWRNMGAAGIQLWQDTGKAGKGITTIVVPDMAAERTRLDAAGLTLSPDVTGNFGVITQIVDPDGNQVNLAEPPKGFAGN